MAMSRSFGATELTSRPSMRISPEVTDSSPAIIASRVDLPQPDGPTSAMNSPFRASRSMPFSTSTAPKFLRSDRMINVDMQCPSLDRASFDGTLRQASHKILAAEEIDQQRRQRADQHGGAHDIVGAHIGAACRQRDERCRDRLLLPGGEDDAEQIFVPDAGELPDHRDDQDR